MKQKTVKGAEAVVLALLEEGVDTLFGYPGGAIMPVYDAMYDYQERLKHILVRHEQGAVHAAQGYARVSGKPGVCMATSGPGATNLITGIADAQIDSTPLVCITGQVSSPFLGSDAFQETDVVGISMPVTKWNVQVTKAADIPTAIAKAFFIAKSGRPGPVLVDITKDAQFGELIFSYQQVNMVRSYIPKPRPSINAICIAAEIINKAEKPFILFGQGILLGNAQQEFKDFVEKTGAPAAWTILGLSALEEKHPLNVGMLGMHGNYGPNLLTNECDVLIAVGMRFDDRVTGNLNAYAKQAKVIHFDIDPSEINKNVKADVAVLGDCKETLRTMLPLLNKREHPDWLQRFKDCDREEEKVVWQNELQPKGDVLSMGEVITLLSSCAPKDAVIVTDVGQHQMSTQRYYKFNTWRTNVTSGGLGTMGFGLPAAIGAAFGRPESLVIAVIGDGGFQMTLQELGTIFQTKKTLKILILNNEFLGMVRQWQDLFFDKRYSQTEMINPDFQLIAQAYGLNSQKVSKRELLPSAMKKFIEEEGASLLEVMVGKENNIFPMVPAGASVAEVRLQ